ncbi:MAG: PepSY-like domain-containing protein [Bacteroidota bacterium]
MKAIPFLLLVSLLWVGCQQDSTSSQPPVRAVEPAPNSSSDEIPDAVLTAFQNQFPSARKIEWKPAGNEWLVNFRDDEGKKKVTYHASGTWIATEDKLEKSDIPQNIMTHYQTQYGDYTLTGVRLFRSKNNSFYKIYVDQDQEQLQLRYTLEGIFIKAKRL